jgi:hypothetical protein
MFLAESVHCGRSQSTLLCIEIIIEWEAIAGGINANNLLVNRDTWIARLADQCRVAGLADAASGISNGSTQGAGA